MPIVPCMQCIKSFYVKPFWIKNGGGKYCSLECKYKGAKKGKIVTCFICSKKVYKKLSKLAFSKSGKYFCGKSCQTKWRNQEFIGPKHANWKYGRSAYRSVLGRYKILKKCTLCGTDDERVIAVHHIDQNRLNNIVENLAWLCHNCHHLVHHDIVEKERFLRKFAKR
jgi:hypothetical protein